MATTKPLRSLIAVVLLASTSALSMAGQAQKPSVHNKQLQMQNPAVQTIKRPHQPMQKLAPNSGPARIECCTHWNSATGTSGCATFAGNVCPDYAPFEAY